MEPRGEPLNSEYDAIEAMLRCSACGSTRVMVLINGKPYCTYCGAKILRAHLIRTLISMKKEGLITSAVNVEKYEDS